MGPYVERFLLIFFSCKSLLVIFGFFQLFKNFYKKLETDLTKHAFLLKWSTIYNIF